MQSLHSQHPHKSVHAALLVMYKNHIQALFILWLMQFSSKSLNTDSLAVLGTLHTCSTSATTLSCAQIPLLLCVTAKNVAMSLQEHDQEKFLHIYPTWPIKRF